MNLQATVNYEFIDDDFNDPKIRGTVLQGSAGSGKTYSTLQWLILHAKAHSGKRIAIYRQFRQVAKESLVPDFKRILQEDMDHWMLEGDSWNGSDLVYTFENGSTIGFFGCDKLGKHKSKRVDISYFCEITEINRENFDEIVERSNYFICDFNPSFEHFVYAFKGDPTIGYHQSTYKDNTFLPKAQVDVIESYEPTEENKARGTANEYRWRVMGLGERARLKGLVFENWHETSDWPDARTCERDGFGCDVGFVDPTTLIECKLHQGRIYVRQRVWEIGMTDLPNPMQGNKNLIECMEDEDIPKDKPIYVDNAYPQTIEALRSYRYNAVGCKKGAGSILQGIQLMQRFPIFIHASSRQLVEEFSQYRWKTNSSGVQQAEPEDVFNHGIDAIRYWCMKSLGNVNMGHQQFGQPSVRIVRGGARKTGSDRFR